MNENHKSIFEKALENLNHPLSMRLSESLTDVQLDENVQNQVKRMDRRAKEKLAKQLNDLDLLATVTTKRELTTFTNSSPVT